MRLFMFVLRRRLSGVENTLGCSLLAPLCVSVKMTVTQTASQRSRPLRPLRPSSLLSWQHSSPLPMTMRRTRGVAMSTKCCQIPTAPRLFTPSTCSPDYFRYIFVAATPALHCPICVCSLILNFTSLFIAEHAKKVQLHYTFIRSLSWGKAPEDG